MKTAMALTTLLALSTPVDADRRTYDVHATTSAWTDLPSCGAGDRMLQDRHVVSVDLDDRHTVTVNGFHWNVVPDDDPSAVQVSFHDDRDQLTYLTMELWVSDRYLIGTYTLYGVLDRTRDGYVRCADKVELRGHR